MPKVKTRKSLAKRITKITSSGKIMRRKMSVQHLARKKSKRAIAGSKHQAVITKADQKRVKKMLPYGVK
jgi:large subunit ribosomal protein L35